jgi:serine/threonine protein kinase
MSPKQIGGHTLVEQLGGGAFASVHKALSPKGEVVAIKVLHATTEVCADVRRRFRREFEVARKLIHPNIVRYLACGSEASAVYIVMEYVEGVSLWDWVQRKGPLAEAEVIHLAGQIGTALDASHELNILHRDVKPNNVLLTTTGDAKLVDFGLVKDLDNRGQMTENQAILGTPFFMPPEQFFDSRTVDHRADIYGLAASLLFALTGRVPFKYRGPGLLEKKLNREFYPPGVDIAGTSPGVIRAIGAGLHPEPNLRPQTGLELVSALRAASRGNAKAAPRPAPPSWTERRTIFRRKCDFAGRNTGDGTRENAVRITDISTEGLCLMAGFTLTPQAVLSLSFWFGDADDHWDYKVRVVNVRPCDGPNWRLGCRFLEPMARAELLALLNEKKGNVRVEVVHLHMI